MFACGQNIGVNAMTSVMATGISTAEKTRLNASKALNSRTKPVAFRTKRVRPPPGGCAPARLAGAALATLLPQTQAYLIGYLALAGLGLRAPLRPWAAVAGAVAVFAAMNAGYLLVASCLLPGCRSRQR
jgi:hypothetical protein